MQTILNRIIDHKRIEVKERKEKVSLKDLEQLDFFSSPTKSLKQYIARHNFGIIAEVKRKSPSAGDILPTLDPVEQAKKYLQGNVAGISVLTDEHFFGGTLDDLASIKEISTVPVLRKDFIIDEYQLFEAKAYGADAILLIAEALTKDEAFHFTIMAQQLGMEVLMECHHRKFLSRINEDVDIIGINNRNLHLQQTDLNISKEMIHFLPPERICISESGIKSRAELQELALMGYHGALIGESILKKENPVEFLQTLQFSGNYVG